MLSPEKKQPTGIAFVIVAMILPGWGECACWPVTALAHEALHLPIVRAPGKITGCFAVQPNHAESQHAGSLAFAIAERCVKRSCGKFRTSSWGC